MAKSFWAVWYNSRSVFKSRLTSIRWVPARSYGLLSKIQLYIIPMNRTWNTIPEEIMGVIPSSINVPLLLANIIRSQYIGSDVSEETMPYNGIWLMTKKIRRVSYADISRQRSFDQM